VATLDKLGEISDDRRTVDRSWCRDPAIDTTLFGSGT